MLSACDAWLSASVKILNLSVLETLFDQVNNTDINPRQI